VSAHELFNTLHELSDGSGIAIQFSDVINVHAQNGLAEAVHCNVRRFDCKSNDGYMGIKSNANYIRLVM